MNWVLLTLLGLELGLFVYWFRHSLLGHPKHSDLECLFRTFASIFAVLLTGIVGVVLNPI